MTLRTERSAHLFVNDATHDRHHRHKYKNHQRERQMNLREYDKRNHNFNPRNKKLLRAVV